MSYKRKFTTIIPPPNVTGDLHIGHGLMLSVIDFFARSYKIFDYEVQVLPGRDHGGISTETSANKFEKIPHELSIDKKFQIINNFANKYKDNIRTQIEKLNILVNWEYDKYTFDIDHINLVQETFVNLYNKGYIYRGLGLVNYDTLLKTSISDLEVEYIEKNSYLYTIKYNIKDTNNYVEVCTTRPETIFGDVALCVHPLDPRYIDLHNQKVLIPIINREIPIICDEYVDINFGTGVLKITPAHDINDYKLSKKYNLEIINIIDKNNHMNIILPDNKYGNIEQKTPIEVRSILEEHFDIIIKKEPIKNKIPISSKSKAPVETIMMEQWFLKQDQVGKIIHDNNKLNIYPDTWKNLYLDWLNNLNDWCISRNMVWGHKIPAWFNGSKYIVSIDKPGEQWIQTTEVLDTWFSSALWPISYKESFNIFPTTMLVTGYDIIYFWVARMVIMCYILGYECPFESVFIHRLVRDKDGAKMSKTKGNVQDPIELCNIYGSDLFKYTMISTVVPCGNIFFSEDLLRNNNKLLEKIKNLHKFLQFKTELLTNNIIFDDISIFFINKLYELEDKYKENLDQKNIHTILVEVRQFIYYICDWLLEFSKVNSQLLNTLKYIYQRLLILLHPMLPILTNELYVDMFQENISILPMDRIKFKVDNININYEINILIDVINNVRSLQDHGVLEILLLDNKFSNIISHLTGIESQKISDITYNFNIYDYYFNIKLINIELMGEKILKYQEEMNKISDSIKINSDRIPKNIIESKQLLQQKIQHIVDQMELILKNYINN